MRRDGLVFLTGVLLGFVAVALGLSYHATNQTQLGDAASVWYPKGGATKYLTPVNNTWGLSVPGLATTTTGCLSVNSAGYISPSGSACGAVGGSGFSTTSAAYFITSTTSLPQLASLKNTLTGTLAANAGTLYTQATTTVSCSGNTTCTSFTTLGSSPITISSTGGGTGLSTTTPVANSNVLVYSSVGAGAAYGAATGTISNGTGISVTAGQSVIGSGLTITNTSPLSGLTATYPFSFSNPTLTWLGLSTTTNSGMAAGNLYVGSGGIFQTAASSSIFGYTPLNPTRALTVAGTANQITSSAGAQDLSADRTWTLSLPSHVIFPGNFQVTNATTTNATTTGSQYFTSSVVANSSLLRTDATGKLSAVTVGTNISFDGTTLSATGGTGSGLATTTPIANSNVLVYSSSGAGAAYGAATGTLTGTGGVTVTGTGSVIGSLTVSSFGYLFPSNATTTELTFTRLVGTNSTSTNATTTNLAILNILNCNSGNKLATNAAGAVICDTDQTGAGGGAFPFTPDTNFGGTANSTTTPVWFKAGLQASSTSNFDVLAAKFSTTSGVAFIGTTTSFTNNGPYQVGAPYGNFVSSCERCGASGGNLLAIANFGGGSTGINTFSARGTSASPAASVAGDALYFMGARGYGTTAWNSGSRAAIQFIAAETFTDTAHGTYITLETTPLLSTTRAERVRIDSTGNVGIGTTSPYVKLGVAGGVVADYFVATTSTSSVLPNLTSINSTTTYATTTELAITGVAGCNTASKLATNAAGAVFCDTDLGGSGSPGGSDTQVQFNDGGSFAGAVGFIWNKTKELLGIGTTTPWNAKVSIATSTAPQLSLLTGGNDAGIAFRNAGGVLYIATTSPITGATSTSPAALSVNYSSGVGKVGIGTSTPFAMLSVSQTTLDYTTPLFAVATSTGTYGTLLTAAATTSTLITNAVNGTGSEVGTRVGIGTYSYYGYGGLLDAFVVEGRFNTENWVHAWCDVAQNVALSADGVVTACPGYYFAEDGTGTTAVGAGSGYQYTRVNVTTTSNDGAGVFVNGSTGTGWLTLATSTPVMEVNYRLRVSPASTTLYVIGFSNINVAGTTYETEPTVGCYFIASSTTANWRAVCRTAAGGATMTLVDTGVASTSNVTGTAGTGYQFYQFRIEADTTKARFYIRSSNSGSLTKVAEITTTYPSTTSLNAGLHYGIVSVNTNSGFDYNRLRVWWRDNLPQI